MPAVVVHSLLFPQILIGLQSQLQLEVLSKGKAGK